MSVIVLLVLVALLIPILGIVIDSPIGRAFARRLEGPDLAKKIELLEADVDDLTRSVQALQEENVFLQRLLEDPTQRVTLPRPQSP